MVVIINNWILVDIQKYLFFLGKTTIRNKNRQHKYQNKTKTQENRNKLQSNPIITNIK